jgi:hypothetical protein
MPFRSQAQWKWAHAAEARGELAPGMARRWAHETRAPYWELPARLHGFGAAPVVVQPLPQQDALWKTMLATAVTAVVSTLVTFWLMEWLKDRRRR